MDKLLKLPPYFTVFADGDCDTTQVMDWLRDYGCPYITFRFFTKDGNQGIVVSSLGPDKIDKKYMQSLDWFDYKGMKRAGNPTLGWVFEIRGNYYYANRFIN